MVSVLILRMEIIDLVTVTKLMTYRDIIELGMVLEHEKLRYCT